MDQSTQTAGTDVDKSSPQTKALLVQDPSTQTENLCLSHHAKYIYTIFCDGLPAVIRAKRNLGIKINKTYSVLMIINVVILADILFGVFAELYPARGMHRSLAQECKFFVSLS